MKRTERHHLKENEVAEWVLGLKHQYEANKKAILWGGLVILILAGAVLGTIAWRSMSGGRAEAMLAEAMTVAEAPVTPPTAGEAGKLPVQPAGTFPSERVKLEAALPKFLAAADAFPLSESGLIARYRAAATLVVLHHHSVRAGRESRRGRVCGWTLIHPPIDYACAIDIDTDAVISGSGKGVGAGLERELACPPY
jgi:hypothetical protein